MVFQCINIRQFLREVLKTAAFGLGFQHLLGTWRMLMHEKTCLIPILVEVGLLTRKITTSRSRQMVVSCRQANPKALSDLSSPTTIVSQYNAARCSEINRTETNNLHASHKSKHASNYLYRYKTPFGWIVYNRAKVTYIIISLRVVVHVIIIEQ